MNDNINCRKNIHIAVKIKNGVIINPFTEEVLYTILDKSNKEDE